MNGIFSFLKNTLNWIVRQFKYRPVPSVLVLLGVPILVSLLFGENGISHRIQLELENRELKASIAAEIKKQDSLKVVIRKLKSDQKYLEHVARTKYGMVKPGENLYKIQLESDDN